MLAKLIEQQGNEQQSSVIDAPATDAEHKRTKLCSRVPTESSASNTNVVSTVHVGSSEPVVNDEESSSETDEQCQYFLLYVYRHFTFSLHSHYMLLLII